MKVVEILLGVCTVGGFILCLIPTNVTVSIKWVYGIIAVALFIVLSLVHIIKEEKQKEKEKVYVKDISFENNEYIIFFRKNQIYHVDALVCVYEDTVPDASLVAIGEVKYCEKNYTTVKIIKAIKKDVLDKFKDNRQNFTDKLFVIPAFKKDYIKSL